MPKKKPAKGAVRAWGLENKETEEIFPEGYRTRSHAESALMGCEKMYRIVRVKIIKKPNGRRGRG